jgi:hypothetical protein
VYTPLNEEPECERYWEARANNGGQLTVFPPYSYYRWSHRAIMDINVPAVRRRERYVYILRDDTKQQYCCS